MKLTVLRKLMMGNPAIVILLTVISSFIIYPIKAQRVGVVLSGGGAKGVAHIGVLRALEQEGIPIHYIAGTSMGAIIGGLYAIGWTTEQMEEVILSEEFQKWSKGIISNEYRLYFKETTPNASWLGVKIRVDSVIQPQLPVNLVSPIVMDYVFLDLYSAATAAARNNFDSLFIPFRCVAADVTENIPVVFRSGDLGSAIRASMTFPFYFRPIRIDGRLLFDGGLYNNFPVDVMLEDFLPDYIIGSRTAGDFKNIKDDDAMSHLEAMLTGVTRYEIPCDAGVLIEPTLEQVNVIDFSNTRAFIDSGYYAAKRKIPEIRSFVFDTVPVTRVNQLRVQYRDKLPDLLIDSIYITGITSGQATYIRRKLKQNQEVISLDRIKPEYFNIMADGIFDYVYPQLRYVDSTGFFDLVLDVKRNNTVSVEFGGNISSTSINTAFVGLKYRLLGEHSTTFYLNTYVGKFYSSAHVSARFDFSSIAPVFIEPSVTFNRWDYFKTSTYFFEDPTPSYLLRNETNWMLRMGTPSGNRGRVTWGYSTASLDDRYYQTNNFTRLDIPDRTRITIRTPFIQYERNTLNAKQFPSSGEYDLVSLRYISASENYSPGTSSQQPFSNQDRHNWMQLRLRIDRFYPLLQFTTLGFTGEIVVSNQPFLSNYTSTMLVASAYEPHLIAKTRFLPKYRSHNYLAGGVNNILKLRKNLDLRFEGHLFLPFHEIGRGNNSMAYYKLPFHHVSLIGAASLVLHTHLGPVCVTYSYFNRNEDPSSFLLNLGYIIFNPQSLQ